MRKKTLEEVYESGFNRFLKALWIIFYVLFVAYITFAWIENEVSPLGWAIMIVCIGSVFEVIKLVFYYVVASTINPEKNG